MNDAELRKMSEVEEKLWWYKNLHQKVIAALKESNICSRAQILDAGCGTGGLLQRLRESGYKHGEGFDLAAESVEHTKKRGFTVNQCSLHEVSKRYLPETYDCVISCDVLCYYPEEEKLQILTQIHRILKKQGLLIMNVPAYEIFSGIHDLSVGIVSRTTKQNLRQQLATAGFEICSLSHWPFLLSPVILLERWRQRRELRSVAHSQYKSDIDLPSPWINLALYITCIMERYLGGFCFFGSSIFVVARINESTR